MNQARKKSMLSMIGGLAVWRLHVLAVTHNIYRLNENEIQANTIKSKRKTF